MVQQNEEIIVIPYNPNNTGSSQYLDDFINK